VTSVVLIWFSTVAVWPWPWPWKCLVLALAWPWAVLKVLGLGLEFSGLGLMTCGLIDITGLIIAGGPVVLHFVRAIPCYFYDEKQSVKGSWSGDVNHLNFGGHQPYIWNCWSYSGQILHMVRLCQVPAYRWQITLKRGVVRSRDPF